MMPTADQNNKDKATNNLLNKETMDSDNISEDDEGRKKMTLHNYTESFFLTDELPKKDSDTNSGIEGKNCTKIKPAVKTEDSMAILQLSPDDSRNMFTSDEEDGLSPELSCIPPSPESYRPVKSNLLPSTPTRNSPSHQSDHSNGDVVIGSSNHSKTPSNKPITTISLSKRITFSQDSVSQNDTPSSTKFEMSEYVRRNINDKLETDLPLKRTIVEVKDSNSDQDGLLSPKRRKDYLSEDEAQLPSISKASRMKKNIDNHASSFVKESQTFTPCKENELTLESSTSFAKTQTETDDIRLYLSGTMLTPQTQSGSENNNDEILKVSETSDDCAGLTSEVTAEKAKFSLNLPLQLESNENPKEESSPNTSVFARVCNETVVAKLVNDAEGDKIFSQESVLNFLENSIDSNKSVELNHSLLDSTNESQEINDNAKALASKRGRIRSLDTQDIAEFLTTEAPFSSSQKRAHSSDENEPKKNLKTTSVSGQTHEIFDIRIREKVVRLKYKDEFNASGILVRSTIISDEIVSEFYHNRTSSTLSNHSSLTSGEMADHSSLPLSKSTTSSMENLNTSLNTVHSGPLDQSKNSSLSLDSTPLVSKLPVKHQTPNLNSSSTSEEMVFKTPWRMFLQRSRGRPKKIKESRLVTDKTSSLCSPEIPEPVTPNINLTDETAIYTGVKVMAKWGDGYYYTGKVGKQKANEKWEVKFDDGSLRDVKKQDLFNCALIKQGQSVLALSNDNYFDSGVIQDFYSVENEEGYVVDFDKGFSLRCKRENVILSGDQAQAIISPKSPILALKLGPDLNLDNILDGKRRRTPTSNKSSSKFSSLVKIKNDVNSLDSSEVDSSLSSEIDSKLKKGKKKSTLTASKTDIIKNVSPKRSPIPRSSPKTHLCTACGENEKSHKSSCPKITSPVAPSRGINKIDSQFSPELKRPGPNSPKKSPRIKRTLENEFEVSKIIPGGKSKIFQGLCFLISCADRCNYDNSNSSASTESDTQLNLFNKSHLLKLLESGGGKILQSFEDIQSHSTKNVLLISNTYLRTLKYIKSLASGIPCIMFSWVLDCCDREKRLSYDPYLLPAGYSILERDVISWHGRNTILKGLHILLFSKSNSMFQATWKPVLLAAQAETVLRIANDKSPRGCLVNVIVSDQSCPGHIIRRANDLNIPIVSSEWVIQCLINGKKLPYDAHKKFNYLYEEN